MTEWIKHDGLSKPNIIPGTYITIKFRDHDEYTGGFPILASCWKWGPTTADKCSADIVEYRLLPDIRHASA